MSEHNEYTNYTEYIEAGRITSAHSFKGEVKIQSWCDSAEFLTRFKAFYLDNKGESSIDVNKIRVANEKSSMLIASFSEINTEEEAVRLKNKTIYIKKQDADLSEGTFFISDLINLTVYDFDTGKKYGVLSDVFNNGASDIYVVNTGVKNKNSKDTEVLIPNVSAFVKKVSLEDGVFITPINGMFED